jgi:methylthioribose-1-phosphate isomerase
MAIRTIYWNKNSIRLIDQTKLPHKLIYVDCRDVETLWEAIKNLRVRGAPAIGIAAAFGFVLGANNFKGKDRAKFIKHVKDVSDYLATSRPTAVNLFNALKRMEEVIDDHSQAKITDLKKLFLKEALALFEEDRTECRRMGQYGARFIKDNATIMTICNAGALATADYGTALGVMYSAKTAGRKFKVYALETRPLLQGARLTAWELKENNIDTTLICDNMAATLMKQKKIDAVFTGADRIASNGDTANKIGTYNLAILAYYHRIPFYVVAPFSTFDMNIASGEFIPIEERKPEEVTSFNGHMSAPKKIKAYNPAFDVTDHELITAIITEAGVILPPFKENIKTAWLKCLQG